MNILEEINDEHFLDADERPIMLDVVIVLPLQRHSLPSFFFSRLRVSWRRLTRHGGAHPQMPALTRKPWW
jgi:hypothetical protein